MGTESGVVVKGDISGSNREDFFEIVKLLKHRRQHVQNTVLEESRFHCFQSKPAF